MKVNVVSTCENGFYSDYDYSIAIDHFKCRRLLNIHKYNKIRMMEFTNWAVIELVTAIVSKF